MKREMSAVVGVCLIFLQAACSGGGASPTAPAQVSPSQAPPSLGAADPAFVGTWTGPMDGSFGPSVMTLRLNAGGQTEFEGTGRYCPAGGNWGIAGTQFTARGSDCTGTIVTLVAPASSTTLTGTWDASSGRVGTFSVTKQ